MGTIAVDVPPRTELRAVIAQLQTWEDAGQLYFETGAPRGKGSFDEAPAPEAAVAMRAMLDAAAAHDARGR